MMKSPEKVPMFTRLPGPLVRRLSDLADRQPAALSRNQLVETLLTATLDGDAETLALVLRPLNAPLGKDPAP